MPDREIGSTVEVDDEHDHQHDGRTNHAVYERYRGVTKQFAQSEFHVGTSAAAGLRYPEQRPDKQNLQMLENVFILEPLWVVR